jgi:hypothetical protein
MPNTFADQIIDRLGGTSEVARLCEINPASVSGWRENGIPHARLMFLKLARPDVFIEERSQAEDRRRSTDRRQKGAAS